MFGTLSGGFWLLLLAVWAVRKVLLAHYQYRLWRLVRTAVVLAFIAGLVCVIIFVPQAMSAGVGIKVRGCDEPGQITSWGLQLLMAGSAPLHLLPPLRRALPGQATGRCYSTVPFHASPSTHPLPCPFPWPQNLILIAFANFYAAAFVVQVLLYCFRGSLTARRIVDQAYR